MAFWREVSEKIDIDVFLSEGDTIYLNMCFIFDVYFWREAKDSGHSAEPIDYLVSLFLPGWLQHLNRYYGYALLLTSGCRMNS